MDPLIKSQLLYQLSYAPVDLTCRALYGAALGFARGKWGYAPVASAAMARSSNRLSFPVSVRGRTDA